MPQRGPRRRSGQRARPLQPPPPAAQRGHSVPPREGPRGREPKGTVPRPAAQRQYPRPPQHGRRRHDSPAPPRRHGGSAAAAGGSGRAHTGAAAAVAVLVFLCGQGSTGEGVTGAQRQEAAVRSHEAVRSNKINSCSFAHACPGTRRKVIMSRTQKRVKVTPQGSWVG